MDKSACTVGSVVHFTCDGRGRGGHYHVTGTVTEVKRKNALIRENSRSYQPGKIWLWPIELLSSEAEYEAQCARSRAAYEAGGVQAVIDLHLKEAK